MKTTNTDDVVKYSTVPGRYHIPVEGTVVVVIVWYNYLCNPCHNKVVSSNLAHGEVYSIHHYIITFVSDLWQSVVFSVFSAFLYQWNLPPRYNWNIIESGVQHHNSNPIPADNSINFYIYQVVSGDVLKTWECSFFTVITRFILLSYTTIIIVDWRHPLQYFRHTFCIVSRHIN